MNVVLDTHAWLWWCSEPARLGEEGRAAIERAETIGVATISCWEVAMLMVRGRVRLDREPRRWITQALARPGVLALPLTPTAAVEAALLAEADFPGDPADRIIDATARELGGQLISEDPALHAYDARNVLW